jgi:DNA polymerase elongation subunit (family B)
MPKIDPLDNIDVIPKLLEKIEEENLDKWRIRGPDISESIQANQDKIKHLMKNYHSPGAVRGWLLGNFIPLRYFPHLKIPRDKWKTFKVGYGRRVGDQILWLPSYLALDGDLGFFLGYFIGDGSARKSFLRLSINAKDTDLIQWFEHFMKNRFGLLAHTKKEPIADMFTLQVNSTALIWILNHVLGVARTRAQGKHKIPFIILNGSKDTIYGFLGGLIASDGDVNAKRNVVRIVSSDFPFIEELAYLAGRVGLYVTIQRSIPQKGTPMYSLCFSGEDSLRQLLNHGYIKHVDKKMIRQKRNKIRSRAWARDLPVVESQLLAFARKARTARNPRISDRVQAPRIVALNQIQRIRERYEKLSPTDVEQLEIIENIINGDLGFAKVKRIERVPSKSKFVYCFEVAEKFHGLTAGTGGIFSHNCFGYQGYRNARFGRIEAHEAISAYGRHTLTQTQQLAANYGLEVCAGIVDSIWLKRPDEQPLSLTVTERLLQEVESATQLPVEHAADYHWIVFLPRRHEPTIGVLNRYYGLRKDGTFKIRGIEIRQSSAPLFVKKMQQKLLEVLAKARTREQFRTQLRFAKKVMQDHITLLEEGNMSLEDLLVTIRPSRTPEEYVSNTRQAIAALQLAKSDVQVEPGMKLSYLIIDVSAKDPMRRVRATQLLTGDEPYDVKEYQKLCIRAYENLIPSEFTTKPPTLEKFLRI